MSFISIGYHYRNDGTYFKPGDIIEPTIFELKVFPNKFKQTEKKKEEKPIDIKDKASLILQEPEGYDMILIDKLKLLISKTPKRPDLVKKLTYDITTCIKELEDSKGA